MLPHHLGLLRRLLCGLEDEDSPAPDSLTQGGTFFQQLAGLSAISCLTIGQSTTNCLSPGALCLRVETVEFYVQRSIKMRSTEFSQSPSAYILIFTHLLALHAPSEKVSDIAYALVEDSGKSNAASSISSLQEWQYGPDCHLALIFADRVLENAETVAADDSEFFEAPHDALCVYLATLVIAINKASPSELSVAPIDLVARTRRDIHLMEKFRVRIAKVVIPLLTSLESMGREVSQPKAVSLAGSGA